MGNVGERRQELLTSLGFRFGANGPHAARTMMLDDLRVLLAHVHPKAAKSDYAAAVIDENILGKPTRKSRELAFRHLATLYALELANPIFRALRHLWAINESAQPMLALAVALARDPLLRSTQAFVLGQSIGAYLPRETVESFLDATFPERFSPASLKSFAQNVGGTWMDAGYLPGRIRKYRSHPEVYPEAVTLLLFLAHLEGRSGQRLFTSDWIQLACKTTAELESLVISAFHRGLLIFMNAGGVQEVRFPGYLTSAEEQIQQEVSHVV